MKAKKPLIGIWDLDDTLGWKTPSYPAISKVNGQFLKQFSSLDCVSSLIATGRPRMQAKNGLRYGGISPDEATRLFVGGVFENGLFVEYQGAAIHNALNEASKEFRLLRSTMLGLPAIYFLKQKGYGLFTGCIIKQNTSQNSISYQVLDYEEKPMRSLEPSEIRQFPNGIVFEQKNDVRATYKAPLGYKNNNVNEQAPFFIRLEPIIKELMHKHYAQPENYASLVRWDDAIEIYPVFRQEIFRKDIGVEMILSRIDHSKEATLIFGCDAKNDIELIDHLAINYSDYIVIAPSNASDELKKKFEEHNASSGQKCFILKQDCTEFGTGALALLKEKGVV
jgi:hydroxymethylpyrimidine pyrophosphatase-like HAD family hydrolase